MELNISELDENVDDLGYFDDIAITPSPLKKTVIKPILKTTQSTPSANAFGVPSLTVASGFGSLQTPSKKKQVTYDDILSSLNMTVVDGKLQIARNRVVENVNIQKDSPVTKNNVNIHSKINSKANNNYKQMHQQQQQQQQQHQQMKQRQQQQPNYDQQYEESEEPGGSMTREQYKRLVLIQYLKNETQRRRINEMKSKKLMFSTISNNNINISPQIRSTTDLNHLFRFAN